jgi:catechol 2,3-dioxygenase-like lactoylglutathione lyase family enzyme
MSRRASQVGAREPCELAGAPKRRYTPRMIEHVSLRCRNANKSRAFYERALAPMDYAVTLEDGDAFGFEQYGRVDFWVTPSAQKRVVPTHIAFTANAKSEVDAFYGAALAAGGRDNGPPGPRDGYGYAAFVFDLDGNNIEAVYFGGKWKNPLAPKRKKKKTKKKT